MSDLDKLRRLNAIGDRIAVRVKANPALLGNDALCALHSRITRLCVQIAIKTKLGR